MEGSGDESPLFADGASDAGEVSSQDDEEDTQSVAISKSGRAASSAGSLPDRKGRGRSRSRTRGAAKRRGKAAGGDRAPHSQTGSAAGGAAGTGSKSGRGQNNRSGRPSNVKAGMKTCNECYKQIALPEFKPGNAVCTPCMRKKDNIYRVCLAEGCLEWYNEQRSDP